MSWKTDLQVRDLENNMKLECTCSQCGYVYYLTKKIMCSAPEREFLYLDEIEAQEICHARGCHGAVTLLLVQDRKSSPFVGGLA
ncbi:hypothetical protein [Bartonella tamiae]|uniref:Uncharacterized protein n=1 Tax=Bartonella tamiae Th239 TaxID=1094558 RepID=J0ZLZ3_9HYPH|nr:hypothetical protein [Bartonella tamiae]EJF89428.1 hypothetical protein ME5_01979 [Bartonella tamiae Th239]EJF92707.1 hypothetical protein MEG_01877 [Bartonella tamiae Th307]